MRVTNHPVLTFPERREIAFTFEGCTLHGLDGEPIAAALHASGVRVLRNSIKDRRARGFYCAIGNCSSCLMEVDGEPNVRVCVAPLRAGMVVNRQVGKGSFDGRVGS